MLSVWVSIVSANQDRLGLEQTISLSLIRSGLYKVGAGVGWGIFLIPRGESVAFLITKSLIQAVVPKNPNDSYFHFSCSSSKPICRTWSFCT